MELNIIILWLGKTNKAKFLFPSNTVKLGSYVSDKGCWCAVDPCSAPRALCGIMWSRVMGPFSIQATYLPPPHPSHCRFSPLALPLIKYIGVQKGSCHTTHRDGPGWSRPRRYTHSKNPWSVDARQCECVLPFIFAIVLLSCGPLLKYLVYLLLIVINF
jgi:hypothetical protein